MTEKELWERQLKATPLGGQTLSKLPSRYVDGVYPKLLKEGFGGRVQATNGKVYVDWIAGLGAVSVGYNNKYIDNAIKAQLDRGISFSLPTTLEADVAERLTKLMPEMAMWKFGKNGVDATLMAIRCARAYTGRKKILVHGYHGCIDHFEALGVRKAGMIDMSDSSVKYDGVLNDNDESYAALIVEPYVFKNQDWKRAKEWCTKTSTALIFDEIVTGGRSPGFAAYKGLGVIPDLITMGKGLANGMPISMVGGPTKIMKTFERNDFFASTTFGGEALSLAACLATLDILEGHISKMIATGTVIRNKFDELFKDTGAYCEGYATRTQFCFPTALHKALFWQECAKRGVLFGYSNFPMVEHTAADIETTVSAMTEASKIVKAYWHSPENGLEGQVPQEVFRMVNR